MGPRNQVSFLKEMRLWIVKTNTTTNSNNNNIEILLNTYYVQAEFNCCTSTCAPSFNPHNNSMQWATAPSSFLGEESGALNQDHKAVKQWTGIQTSAVWLQVHALCGQKRIFETILIADMEERARQGMKKHKRRRGTAQKMDDIKLALVPNTASPCTYYVALTMIFTERTALGLCPTLVTAMFAQ